MARPHPAFLLTAALSLGCGAKKAEGGTCENNEACGEGLVCVASQCSDAKKSMRLRARNLQKKAQSHLHNNDGQCPTIADLGEAAVTNDAWDRPFSIKCPSEHSAVDLVSAGADGVFDTPDDLASWDK